MENVTFSPLFQNRENFQPDLVFIHGDVSFIIQSMTHSLKSRIEACDPLDDKVQRCELHTCLSG